MIRHQSDWPMAIGTYGCKYVIYDDNEYDTALAFFNAFARTGNNLYLETAYHSAIHMTDVDRNCLTGDMRFHYYYDNAENHGHNRSPQGDLGRL